MGPIAAPMSALDTLLCTDESNGTCDPASPIVSEAGTILPTRAAGATIQPAESTVTSDAAFCATWDTADSVSFMPPSTATCNSTAIAASKTPNVETAGVVNGILNNAIGILALFVGVLAWRFPVQRRGGRPHYEASGPAKASNGVLLRADVD
ncbi:hypothetical protein LTR53_005601 [Teratosphaeriaceae sp. CCFEE 6253]|nr:hypothetical protein LTR53_005601 [Teratosphaeriaceae sp. CCFEE 6253]